MNHVNLNTSYQKGRGTLRNIVALAMTLMCTGCVAMSRMESAVVTDREGLPCFSVPHTSETATGIPLYGISVDEPKAVAGKTMPDTYWTMGMSPPGNSILLQPHDCIRYGDKPANSFTPMGPAKPLEPFHVYFVTLNARPAGSNIGHYGAKFCLKPAANGKMKVQQIFINESEPDRPGACTQR